MDDGAGCPQPVRRPHPAGKTAQVTRSLGGLSAGVQVGRDRWQAEVDGRRGQALPVRRPQIQPRRKLTRVRSPSRQHNQPLADDARYATNPDRCEHRDELNAAIESWCAQHDLAEIQKIADAAGIGNSRYNLPSEVIVHPHLQARDRWRPVQTPKGEITTLRPPPVIAGFEQPMGAVPGLGEHTDSVLAGLGLSDDDIAALRADGAIGPAYQRSE